MSYKDEGLIFVGDQQAGGVGTMQGARSGTAAALLAVEEVAQAVSELQRSLRQRDSPNVMGQDNAFLVRQLVRIAEGPPQIAQALGLPWPPTEAAASR